MTSNVQFTSEKLAQNVQTFEVKRTRTSIFYNAFITCIKLFKLHFKVFYIKHGNK